MMRSLYYSLCFFATVAEAAPTILEEQLKSAIFQQDSAQIQQLLTQYQQQANTDPILTAYANAKLASLEQNYALAISLYRQIISQRPELNSIRMELAITLFEDRQDSAARLQFEKVQSVPNLPQSAYTRISRYLEALNHRNRWQIDGTLSYLSTDNVENVSSSPTIENTGFVKNEKMLPQKANGIAYNISISRDFNLIGSHYLGLSNDTVGKSYWNNHTFDDIYNRSALGYAYKNSENTLRIQPFYEKRWFGGQAFHWSNGIEFSYSRWLSPNWQSQTTLEYEKRHFFQTNPQAGHIKTVSTTVIWYRNPQQIFYLGGAFSQEKLQERQYSANIKNIRLGWLQEYPWGISTKLNFNFTQRQFKDEAILGGILPLGKIRKDNIYTFVAQIWKRDWHIWGITPKLNLEWRKQKSNLNTLYSYQYRQITLSFEKTF